MTTTLPLADTSRNFLRSTRSVASLNVLSVAASSVAGFLLASIMSSSTRGAYAGIQSWFWISQVLGQLGLASSLTYHVARYPRDWRNYLGATQRTLAVCGIVAAAFGAALSPTLGRGSPGVAAAYTCVFLALPATMIFGTYVFVLQAQSLKLWNRARLVQPCLYLAFVVLVVCFHRHQLIVAVAVLVVSAGVQGVIARQYVYRLAAPSASCAELVNDHEIRARLLRYGFANLLGAGPELVNTRLDQLVLSVVSPLASLGQYAIAVSISNLALPAVVSLGQVALPRLAAAEGKTTRHIVLSTMIVAPALAAVVGIAAWLIALVAVPALLGPGYAAVPHLVLLLLPGTIALGSGSALGDVLRGLGRPALAGIAQAVGAVLTVVGLIVLVPLFNAEGAAVVSSVAYCCVWGLEVVMLCRIVPSHHASRRAPGRSV